jgi:hypothetical protein
MQQFHFLRTNLFAATLLVTAGLAAQSDCTDHHKFNCERSPDTRFSINGQSKSASVQVGVPTELNIILYKGQDYRISLAHDTRILGEHLSIRLVEKVREPKVVEVQVTEKQAVMDANGEPTGALGQWRPRHGQRDRVQRQQQQAGGGGGDGPRSP